MITAEEAKKLAHEKLWESIMFTISACAKNGMSEATWNLDQHRITEEQIAELKKLGYSVEISSSNYLTASW